MRVVVFAFIACCSAATAANAQGMMPTIIGNAVGNAGATGCMTPHPVWVEKWGAQMDRSTLAFRAALIAGDGRALKRASHGAVDVRWPDGTVAPALGTAATEAGTGGAELEKRKLVIGGDLTHARGVWKGVDTSGADLWLAADYTRSAWTGTWKLSRLSLSTGAEPTIPDSFCTMAEVAPLW